MYDYEEIETTIGDLRPGDMVMGSDGEWYEIDLLPIHTPDRMFRLDFANGSVECSGDHEWTYFDKHGESYTIDTTVIYNYKPYNYNYGKPDGPMLLNITEILPKESRCIEVDNNDHLFEILTDEGEPVLTHNCQMRLVCGRLGRTASMMALDSTLATTIDSEVKGKGIISAQGIVQNVQYYFADQEWIEDWYAKRGLNKDGSQPGLGEEDDIFDDFEGVEELDSNKDKVEIEFGGVKGEVDKTPDQKFEEV